jgi:hypothetical protein
VSDHGDSESLDNKLDPKELQGKKIFLDVSNTALASPVINCVSYLVSYGYANVVNIIDSKEERRGRLKQFLDEQGMKGHYTIVKEK